MKGVLGSTDHGQSRESIWSFIVCILRNGGVSLLGMPSKPLVQVRNWKGGAERWGVRARLHLGLWSFFLQDNGPILICYILSFKLTVYSAIIVFKRFWENEGYS